MGTQWIILGMIGLLLLWVIVMYNGLIRLKNRVKEAWSDIDVQLKRRYELIPNLVESVKGYMHHEQSLLENITKARGASMQAEASGNTKALAQAESTLGGLLGNLRVAFEAYPDLKANQNMAQLMDELSDTENKIQASRRFYNGNVRDFNTKLETFPTNIFGKLLKFTTFDFFEITDAKERESVAVRF